MKRLSRLQSGNHQHFLFLKKNASFQHSIISTNREVISTTSLKTISPKIEAFDHSIYEALSLKPASEITIIDKMIFDNHSKLNMSSIHSISQDDWSHDSESA